MSAQVATAAKTDDEKKAARTKRFQRKPGADGDKPGGGKPRRAWPNGKFRSNKEAATLK